MKSTMKLFLVVILFSSVVIADEGNMGNGTKSCPNGQTSCFVSTPTTGGAETKIDESTTSSDSSDTILISVKKYFDSMIKYFRN